MELPLPSLSSELHKFKRYLSVVRYSGTRGKQHQNINIATQQPLSPSPSFHRHTHSLSQKLTTTCPSVYSSTTFHPPLRIRYSISSGHQLSSFPSFRYHPFSPRKQTIQQTDTVGKIETKSNIFSTINPGNSGSERIKLSKLPA